MNDRLSIVDLKGGAIVEMGDHMLMELVENVMDPNTKPDAVRKLSFEIVVKPGKDRSAATFQIRTKSTLAPQADVEGTLSFGFDSDGLASASEVGAIDPNRALLPGTVTDNKSAAAGDTDEDEIPETSNQNVTPLKRAGGM